MSAFRIVIDQSLCSGFGSCIEQAPTAFLLNGSGVATARVSETDDASVIDAAAACPMGAIEIYDCATGERVA